MSEESTQEAKEPLDVYAVLATMVDQMAAISWQKLGLQPDFVTGRLEPNVEQARVAVDVVAKLVDVLETDCDEADRRRLQGLVRDLRLNYVAKHKEAGV